MRSLVRRRRLTGAVPRIGRINARKNEAVNARVATSLFAASSARPSSRRDGRGSKNSRYRRKMENPMRPWAGRNKDASSSPGMTGAIVKDGKTRQTPNGRPLARSRDHRRIRTFMAPVAQLDRALPSGGRGRGFESLRACHLNTVT